MPVCAAPRRVPGGAGHRGRADGDSADPGCVHAVSRNRAGSGGQWPPAAGQRRRNDRPYGHACGHAHAGIGRGVLEALMVHGARAGDSVVRLNVPPRPAPSASPVPGSIVEGPAFEEAGIPHQGDAPGRRFPGRRPGSVGQAAAAAGWGQLSARVLPQSRELCSPGARVAADQLPARGHQAGIGQGLL